MFLARDLQYRRGDRIINHKFLKANETALMVSPYASGLMNKQKDQLYEVLGQVKETFRRDYRNSVKIIGNMNGYIQNTKTEIPVAMEALRLKK